MKLYRIAAILGAALLIAAALGFASTAQSTPTAPEPTPSQSEFLAWESLDGPYERVTYALAIAPGERRSSRYAGSFGHGVYRSYVDHTKLGDTTWKPASSGLERVRYITALDVLHSNGRIVFAGTSGGGLHRSPDGGGHWEQVGNVSPPPSCPAEEYRLTSGLMNDQSFTARHPLRVESILVVPGPVERVWVGTQGGIWLSEDQGCNWDPRNDGLHDRDDAYNVQALAHSPDGVLYAGTLDGLYASRDDGATWRFLEPPDDAPQEARRILSLAFVTDTLHAEGVLLVGTKGAGVYAVEEFDAPTWVPRREGFPEDPHGDALKIQALLHVPGDAVYAGTVDNGVLVSRDSGQSWQQIKEGLPDLATSVLSLAYDRADGRVYVGTYGDGVYRLAVGGDRWEADNKELPVDFPVQEMGFAGQGSKRLLVGLQVGGMYLYDRQQPEPKWQRLPKALPIGPARDVADLVVGGDTVVIASSTGITFTTDAGVSWTHAGGERGLPDGEVAARALVWRDGGRGALYAALAGGQGLYRSDNGGQEWRPAAGGLGEALRTSICCLAVGADDDALYAGLENTAALTQSVYVTHDGGVHWNPLSSPADEVLQQLAWSRRSHLDVFVYGGRREMLYARTDRGIYVSYDRGQSWTLRLRGFFNDLLVDPRRPWAVYVASPRTRLDKEYSSPVSLSPDLWASYDGGETWTWAGPGPSSPTQAEAASITSLAMDSRDRNRIFAGTEGTGVFQASLPSRGRALAPRSLIALLLLIAVAYVGGTGLTLGRRNQVPFYRWPQLAWLNLFYSDQVSQVGRGHSALDPLERLVVALAPEGRFDLEALTLALSRDPILVREQILVERVQLEAALEHLKGRYRLLRVTKDNAYALNPVLRGMARNRFWKNQVVRRQLIREVQGQNQLRNVIRGFFQLADFQTFPSGSGFQARSSRPEYALLGAGAGIYVHPYRETGAGSSIVEVRDGALRAYDESIASRIALLVVSCCPELGDLRAMIDLRREEGFWPVLLPFVKMRNARNTEDCRAVLDRSLQRALGGQDLFDLDTQDGNPLDFWGRQAELGRLQAACEEGQAVGLAGMRQVGKTALVRQTVGRLPNALIAWLAAGGSPRWTLYADLYEQWLKQARMRLPTWEQLAQPPPARPRGPAEIRDHLALLRASLADQDRAVHLAAVVDGLPGVAASWEPLTTLAQAAAEAEGVSLLCTFQQPVQVEGIDLIYLKPLEQEEGEEMIHVLAAQMGFEFEPEAAERLHELAGGHPLILRQLASRTVLESRTAGEPIQDTGVEEATVGYLSQPGPALSNGKDLLQTLRDSLSKDEQEIVQTILRGEVPRPGSSLSLLQDLGWLRTENGGWALFSQVLARWLEIHPPSS